MSNQPFDADQSRGQATVEFALLLPLLALCIGVLFAVVTACLSTLRLNDIARVAARSAVTGSLNEASRKDLESTCTCNLLISSTSDIVTVRAEQSFTFPLVGISLPILRLHAESLALKESPVIFQSPKTP